jgi:hypothetical protein
MRGTPIRVLPTPRPSRASGVIDLRADHMLPSEVITPSNSIDEMKTDVERAFSILRRTKLPIEYARVRHGRAGVIASAWPDTLRSRSDYDAGELVQDPVTRKMRIRHDTPRIRPAVPTPQEISFLDSVLDLFSALNDPFDRVLVSGRALRVSWAKLAEIDVKRRSRQQLHKLHCDALRKLLLEKARRNPKKI